MKTNREIQVEAQRLTVLGKQYQMGHRDLNVTPASGAAPRSVVNLPSTGRERYVDATIAGDALAFRLMERETDFLGLDRADHDDEARVVVSGPSAYDILRTGYERAETDRLSVALEPYTVEGEDHRDSVEVGVVAEVEEILETNFPSLADQIRTKADIGAFLEGRLERSVLIARAIERQLSRDGGYCERAVERHEHKITIGEP